MSLTLRSGAAILIASAVALVPLLPPEHIHRAGIEGRTTPLVHAHPLDQLETSGPSTGTSGSIRVGHGNHGLAIFLSTYYDSVSPFGLQPIALLPGTTITAPPLHPVRLLHVDFGQRAHGPPRVVSLSRAPPSLS